VFEAGQQASRAALELTDEFPLELSSDRRLLDEITVTNDA
jgi:hypothetical protein